MEWVDHYSPLYRANYALLLLALEAAGYDLKRYSTLEPYCQTHETVSESRKNEWVQYYINALALKVDLNTVPNISGCELGNLNAKLSGARAWITLASIGLNNDIKWTATPYGTIGNTFSLEYANTGNTNPITVQVFGSRIRILLSTTTGVINSTASQVIAAVNNNITARKLMTGSLIIGNDGSGLVSPVAQTFLLNGAD